MEFYSDLSVYFEDIFPLREPKMKLIGEYVKQGASILDIGCSTGELAIALAKKGYQISGTDLNQEMIEKAKRLADEQQVATHFQVGDMRQLTEMYQEPFDAAVCFGNTIVHLTSAEEIRGFFKQVYEILQDGGTFIFQIVNYDRVLLHDVRELPTIRNEEKELTFYRDYEYDQEKNLVTFKTRLVLDSGEERVHSITLYPLQTREIREILLEVGFAEFEFFGNFQKGRFDSKDSMPLVVVAHKG